MGSATISLDRDTFLRSNFDWRPLPSSVVSDLQQRLKAIEGLIRGGGGAPSSFQDDVLTPSSNPTAARSESQAGTVHSTTPHVQSHTHGDSQAIAQISNGPEEHNAIDGPSSNTAFLRQIQGLTRNITVPSISDCIKHGTITVSHSSARSRRLQADQIKNTNEFILPSQPHLESLINDYFSHTTLFFPYVHEAAFRAVYVELKNSGFKSARRTWLALLNMVLAISAKQSAPSSDSESKTGLDDTVYYRRAAKLCNDYIFCATSLEMVQCLLLMAWYLQSTQDSTRTWFIHGLAVRAAISLGLHSDLATKDLSAIEKEERIRVWYGCIDLDRTLGLSFGRPWSIPKSFTLLRRPSPFLTATTSLIDFEPRASRVDKLGVLFLRESIELSDIVVDIVATLYGDNLGFAKLENSQGSLPKVISLVGRLEAWWAQVHPSVRWHSTSSVDDNAESRAVEVLKFMLKLDFLNAQLLLYRPVVFMASQVQTTAEEEEHALFPKIVPICVRKSLHCACMVVSILQDLQKSGSSSGGSPWLSLYQVFHAALSAFAVLLLRPDLLPLPLHQNLFVLERAVEVLDNLSPGNKMGHACADYVQLLLSTLRNTAGGTSIGRADSNLAAQPQAPPNSGVMLPPTSMPTYPAAQTDFGNYELADINLAQFFSQDQMDFFGLDGIENGLI
ncbi:uncharacterized protein PV06_05555 [Exophiala oligosperma]|uniref:Xylanolytic transcriptional activator regulatory domain-containing protein n=1 Tax=Exophiala oligosperma TaxID=215243 RepID=A0A0D2APW3_9EURO|nr:uncharacterized protein PV06_05555 [Exophiala oligosperma]KIW41961.1 hypothetical protein PV06_05555 [Exophiala oligosperma]